MSSVAGSALVLAAGKGTRMRSEHAKVLHEVLGKPMILHVLDTVRKAGFDRSIVVVGHGAAEVETLVSGIAQTVLQREQRGTAHAVETALQAILDLPEAAPVTVLYGDMPLLRPATLQALLKAHETSGLDVTVLTVTLADPAGYGRIVRDEAARLEAIVEDKDANAKTRAICEINTGIAVFRLGPLREALQVVTPQNAQGEYYLTDAITALARKGRAGTLVASEPSEGIGINDRVQLAAATRTLRMRILTELMEGGVTVIDPESTFIGPDVRVEPDAVIAPFTRIEGASHVEAFAVVGPMSEVRQSRIGAHARVEHAVVESSDVGPHAVVGPFAHLRPGSRLAAYVLIGNYAEIKNCDVGAHTKVHHHCYLGDATIGEHVNIGAGTVVVNYDGAQKHRTRIGDGAFIGCNANLVAPVEVATGAWVGAGSTITKLVPEGALGIARARQTNLEGWVDRRQRPQKE